MAPVTIVDDVVYISGACVHTSTQLWGCDADGQPSSDDGAKKLSSDEE